MWSLEKKSGSLRRRRTGKGKEKFFISWRRSGWVRKEYGSFSSEAGGSSTVGRPDPDPEVDGSIPWGFRWNKFFLWREHFLQWESFEYNNCEDSFQLTLLVVKRGTPRTHNESDDGSNPSAARLKKVSLPNNGKTTTVQICQRSDSKRSALRTTEKQQTTTITNGRADEPFVSFCSSQNSKMDSNNTKEKKKIK